MKTKLCEMLGIEFPLLAFSHCRDVVAEVSKAGGFGVFGAAMITPQQLKIELDWIDAHIDGKPYGLDFALPENMPNRGEKHQTTNMLKAQIPEKHKRFVEELLTRYSVNPNSPVEADEDRDLSYFLDTAELMVEEGLHHPIRLMVNALGLPPKFMVNLSHAAGVAVGALVGSREHALRQLDAGVDVLVAQGTEAAAHCGEVTTMVMVPEVVEAVQKVRDVPVLAAGGIVTGRQMAAVMAMGAAGAWTGSVWLPTVESNVTQADRDRILTTNARDTFRSRAMTGKLLRQSRSAWNEAWEDPESPGALPFPYQHLLYDRAMQQVYKSIEGGNEKARPLVTEPIGQGVGMINSVMSVRSVVFEFMKDFAEALERMNVLVD